MGPRPSPDNGDTGKVFGLQIHRSRPKPKQHNFDLGQTTKTLRQGIERRVTDEEEIRRPPICIQPEQVGDETWRGILWWDATAKNEERES